MPTTVTRHIRETPGGGEFGSLNAARADAVTQGEGDLVTDDTILEFVVHGHSTQYDTASCIFSSSSFTTSATNYILITFGGEADPYDRATGAGDNLKFSGVHARIEGPITVTVDYSGSTASAGVVLDGSVSSVEVIANKVTSRLVGTPSNDVSGFATDGQGTLTMRNCVSYGWRSGGTSRGVECSNPSSTISLQNCTVHDCQIGVDRVGGTLNASNTRSTGNTTDWSGTFGSGSHNLSSDGTAPGTSPQANATVSYTDAANADFSLQSGDDGINNGTDLSPDVTVDFEGTSRPQGSAYDIGAYEFVEAGGATGSVVDYVSPTLDGPAVMLGDGSSVMRYIRIPAAEYATPIWVRPDGDNARTQRYDALPAQIHLVAGQIEVLSSAPV